MDVDLSLYSRDELANFRHSVGFQLAYKYGWVCWLGLLPCVKSGHGEVRKDILKEQSFVYKCEDVVSTESAKAMCLRSGNENIDEK